MRFSRLAWLAACTAALSLGSAAGLWAAGPPLGAGSVRAIEVRSQPVPLDRREPARRQLGALEWAGGLALSSPEAQFGGISGTLWEAACARLLAVTDTGSWVVLEPRLEGGMLAGIAAAWIGPILGEDGQPPASKRDADAEAVHRMADGEIWVWFEGDHRAQRYRGVSSCAPETLATSAHAVFRPAEIQQWPRNGAVESAAPLGAGAVVIAEHSTNGEDRREGWWFDGDARHRFELVVDDGHAPVGLAALDDSATGGRYLLLGRRFSLMRGLSARLDIIRLGMPPAGLVEREPLAVLAGSVTLDNLEAVAVSHEPDGPHVWLLSDDNFMPFQRNLLLRFRLPD